MKIGMLYYDNSQDAMDNKIRKALTYYEKKHNRQANLVYINPKQMNGLASVEGAEIRPNRSILPNHFWIGVAEG